MSSSFQQEPVAQQQDLSTTFPSSCVTCSSNAEVLTPAERLFFNDPHVSAAHGRQCASCNRDSTAAEAAATAGTPTTPSPLVSVLPPVIVVLPQLQQGRGGGRPVQLPPRQTLHACQQGPMVVRTPPHASTLSSADVIIGSSGTCVYNNKHDGVPSLYHAMIQRWAGAYRGTPLQQEQVARQVVQDVQAKGGRFLQRCTDKNATFVLVSKAVAARHVSRDLEKFLTGVAVCSPKENSSVSSARAPETVPGSLSTRGPAEETVKEGLSLETSTFISIASLNLMDVLIGPTGTSVYNRAWSLYRRLIQLRARDYMEAPHLAAQQQVASQLIQVVQENGGRFLQRCDDKNSLLLVSETVALRYVSQDFEQFLSREAATRNKRAVVRIDYSSATSSSGCNEECKPLGGSLKSQTNSVNVNASSMKHDEATVEDCPKPSTSKTSSATANSLQEYDVLLGTDKFVVNRQGNRFYRMLIRRNAREYHEATDRASKRKVAQLVMAAVVSKGGRVLRKNSEEAFVQLSEKQVFKRVSTALKMVRLQDMDESSTQNSDGELSSDVASLREDTMEPDSQSTFIVATRSPPSPRMVALPAGPTVRPTSITSPLPVIVLSLARKLPQGHYLGHQQLNQRQQQSQQQPDISAPIAPVSPTTRPVGGTLTQSSAQFVTASQPQLFPLPPVLQQIVQSQQQASNAKPPVIVIPYQQKM